MIDEITIGPFVFEYDAKTQMMGIAIGAELVGTAEFLEKYWYEFVAATGKDGIIRNPETGKAEVWKAGRIVGYQG